MPGELLVFDLCNFGLSLATFFFETNVSTAFQQPSSVTGTKTNESDLYAYNSIRKRGRRGDRKIKGEDRLRKNQTGKQTTHSMSAVSHFRGSVFTPSFVAMC